MGVFSVVVALIAFCVFPGFAAFCILALVVIIALAVAASRRGNSSQDYSSSSQSSGSKYNHPRSEILSGKPIGEIRSCVQDQYEQVSAENKRYTPPAYQPEPSSEYTVFLFEWQQVIHFGHPNSRGIDSDDPMRTRLCMSESELRNWNFRHWQNSSRIIKDCLELIQSTVNPDVFYMRLDLLEAHARFLVKLSGFSPLPDNTAQEIMRDITNIRQNATSAFLKRSFYHVTTKAQTLKTERGKLNRYHKHYEDLQKYRHLMSPENNSLLDEIYYSYVGDDGHPAAEAFDDFIETDFGEHPSSAAAPSAEPEYKPLPVTADKYFGDMGRRAVRHPATGKTVFIPRTMSYEQWCKECVETGSQEAPAGNSTESVS
ncbi:MAG: hypothetical protein J6M10_10355 [Clostridia bacterium]|nr:hypothetical protein [Clostridia bacterium]